MYTSLWKVDVFKLYINIHDFGHSGDLKKQDWKDVLFILYTLAYSKMCSSEIKCVVFL